MVGVSGASGVWPSLGLPEAKAPGNGVVTNVRLHECQGLVNPFLFLNRLMARRGAFCNFLGSQSPAGPGAPSCASSTGHGQGRAGLTEPHPLS